MIIMLLVVGGFFGALFAYHASKARALAAAMRRKPPPQTVSTMKAAYQPWQPEVQAVGTLAPVLGVEVTAQIAGLVEAVLFRSGDTVEAGQVLVQLNADPDVAKLHSLQAEADLAKIVYDRDTKQLEIQAVSQAALDADEADLRSKRALAAQQAALVDEKTIRAPFAGRLGITAVNPGQYLNPGDKIVTLQSLDPIYADFYLPQQELSRVSVGQTLTLTADAYKDGSFTGKITAINPKVDPVTRNFLVEGTLPNPKGELRPGMFVSVSVQAGAEQRYLTLPKTVVTYNSYGDTVFVVKPSGQEGPNGGPVLTATETFVTVGPTRGDQVAILKGISEGDEVVTSGQIKLRNGSEVAINNKVQPANEAAPNPVEG